MDRFQRGIYERLNTEEVDAALGELGPERARPHGIALVLGLVFSAVFAGDSSTTRLHLDLATTFQTWEAWSCMPNPPGYEKPFAAWLEDPTLKTYDRVPVDRDLPWKLIGRMHDALVFDLGITRMRLEVGPQVEPVNDDEDPSNTVVSAYRFEWQDDLVERHILPVKQRVEKAGGTMTIYVSYDLRSALTPAFLLRPDEYAEMAVTFLRHLKQKYALEPEYWSVLNEPGNGRPGGPELCAELTAATGRRIADAGLRTRMSGPECVTVAQAEQFLKAMTAVPGALDHFRQITYHLYHGGAEDVSSRNVVREWAKKLKVTAAQTEWMEAADIDVARHIHLCLTEADATVWDRFGADLFFALRYDAWLDPGSDALTELPFSSTAWHIRQFSRHIRPGAVRVALGGGSESVKGVAFRPKSKGLPVIVLLNVSGESQHVELDGLPAGTYGGCFTSEPRKAHGERIEERTTTDGRLTIELAPRSVTTITAPGA